MKSSAGTGHRPNDQNGISSSKSSKRAPLFSAGALAPAKIFGPTANIALVIQPSALIGTAVPSSTAYSSAKMNGKPPTPCGFGQTLARGWISNRIWRQKLNINVPSFCNWPWPALPSVPTNALAHWATTGAPTRAKLLCAKWQMIASTQMTTPCHWQPSSSADLPLF